MDSHRSELISIYGRKRIGKTHLIREFYSNRITFSFSGLRDGTRPDQIKNFMIELRSIYNDKYTIDSDYAAKLRNKETQFKINTSTKKGLNTIMITTWGITGNHGIGLVTASITMDSLFQ